MGTVIAALDLSPLPDSLDRDDEAWLQQVGELDPRHYMVGIDPDRDDDEPVPIVSRASDGRWWAGRYIGSISAHGRRLVIEPRLGIDVIEAWLDHALGLVAPPASARHEPSAAFIVRLLARVWCRSLDNATRHGLPALRLPTTHTGLYVRGRLDLRRTLELQRKGVISVASTSYERSLVHPATRAIVCAERALADRLAEGSQWRTERVRQVIPHLRGAVGSRPVLPTLHEISRVRYTPITFPFKRVALLSHRIASKLGYSAGESEGDDEGLLIDVAELWELFVLNCARQAAPAGVQIAHGTTDRRRTYLLRSDDGKHEMARVKPDVLALHGTTTIAVIDAKYKRLENRRDRPTGVEQADLYQLAAYAHRFRPTLIAALVYPQPPKHEEATSTAETLGPWTSDEHSFAFRRLPVTVAQCRDSLAEMLEPQRAETKV